MRWLFGKNASPRFLAVFSALLVTILFVFILLYLEINLVKILILCFFIFTVVSVLFYYIIETFFYRKIKLLYKFISQTKAGYKEETLREFIKPSMDQVSSDVQSWAAEQQKEIDVLQKNEQYRKEFLMNFSHEIKTPIFTIQGYLQTLADGALQDEANREKFVNNALKGANRLSHLVEDIDEITKLEVGTFKINSTEFVFINLVQDVLQELQLEASKNNIKIKYKEGCNLNIVIKADEAKIKQVLVNLLANAIKYSFANSTVTIGLYIVDNKNAYAEVTDEGAGISEDQLPRVFERFYRTDDARSRHKGGSGLGLSIVKHIVEAHGHSVTCRSTVGVGSSFGFGLSI